MIKEKKELHLPLPKNSLMQMKGQSVPLLGYHLIRDHILSAVTGEYQSSILYWAGKTLAEQFHFETFEDCQNFFLDAGWGYLENNHSTPYLQRFTLESPQFQYRLLKDNESTFALECGFLSRALGIIENKETEGDYKLHSKDQKDTVQFIVYFQDSLKDDKLDEGNVTQAEEKPSKEKE